MSNKQLNIGIIGLGTVGSGEIETLEKKNNYFKRKYNLEIIILGISANSKNKKRSFNVKKYKWYNNPLDIIDIKNYYNLTDGEFGLIYAVSTILSSLLLVNFAKLIDYIDLRIYSFFEW